MAIERRGVVGGVVLILLGLGFYFADVFRQLDGGVFLGALGTAFLVAYLLRRRYPLLVPAGVLLGLAAGSLLDDLLAGGVQGELLGLAAGFLAIFLVHLVVSGQQRWWPVAPAAVLALLAFPGGQRWLVRLVEDWPLVLILVGAVLLGAALLRRGGAPESEPPG